MRRLTIIGAALTLAASFARDATAQSEAPKVPQAVAALAAIQHPPVQGNSGAYAWDSGTYQYDAAGNIVAIGNQAYRYDVDSRLTTAHVTHPEDGSTQDQTFTYDSYGNLTAVSDVGVSTTLIPVNAATNRLTGNSAGYDAAGDLVQYQPGSTMEYLHFDGLNTLMTVTPASGTGPIYVYTADDERLRVYAGNVSHYTLRDLGGKVLRDYSFNGTSFTISRDYIYRDGQLLAAVTPTTTEHYSLDHLGTPRLITDATGTKLGFHTYLPYGKEWIANSQQANDPPMKFTGHERDAAIVAGDPSLDYMHARYYGAAVGRFLSVDPLIGTRSVADPQAWNRYAYVNNRPIRSTDPDGRDVWMQNWSPADQETLLRQLEAKTGLNLNVVDGKLLEVGAIRNANGSMAGSQIARDDLRRAMAHGRDFKLRSGNVGRGMAVKSGDTVIVNMARIREVNTGTLPGDTLDASMIVIHELLGHALNGKHDPPHGMLMRQHSVRGDTVDYDNRIREQLGLPQRLQYLTEPDRDGSWYIPFAGGKVHVPEPEASH